MEKLEIGLKVIHPNWKPIIKKNIPELHKVLSHILEDVSIEQLTPNIEDVFKAFRIDPNGIRVVIIGQDPYPGCDSKSKQKYANGLSFSTTAKTTPASLRNIFSCLNRLGYKTESNDLMPWLLQGVFLLNMSLTTQVGITRKHSDIWKTFISNIIGDLSIMHKGSKLSFMLWGKDAQSLECHIKGKHNVLKWSHPSPMADNQLEDSKKFINCNHFDDLKCINWNTGDRIVIYTDGGGFVEGKCSFGIYWTDILKLGGLVQSYEYELKDYIHTTSVHKTPTSQRGEYLAMCYALWIIDMFGLKNVLIITDSQNVKGILTEWSKKDEKYKNDDLVKIMRSIYNKNKKYIDIEHVKSHCKEASIYNKGNEIADKIASNMLKTDVPFKIEYLKVDFNLVIKGSV